MVHEFRPSTERLTADWRVLCTDIGVRLAGTDAEAAAAAYIRDEFKRAGLENPRFEEFPCRSLRHSECEVAVQAADGGWRTVPSRALTGAPGTPDGQPVEGEVVWIELPEQESLLRPEVLEDRIAVIFGPLPTSVAQHKALVAAKPQALVHIDERLPFPWPKNDGTYPLWVRKYGMPTIVTVPYTEAWNWRKNGGQVRLRIRVETEIVEARSQNVIADLPGTSSRAGMIVVGAHHDTQANNVGADDNASGVVAILELARLLAPLPRRRAIRFVSFGTEEQLSVGSAAYVLRHTAELNRIALMMNFDSVSSPLGHYQMIYAAHESMAKYVQNGFQDAGVYVSTRAEAIPFADHFCFSVYGVPSLFLYRPNMSGSGRWQHHSEHDNLDNVSAEVVATLLRGAANVLLDAANRPRLPFRRGLPPALRSATLELADTLFCLHPETS